MAVNIPNIVYDHNYFVDVILNWYCHYWELDFSVTYSFLPYHDPGVDSAPTENEYQEHSWA
jgi:hypothetical protein